MNISDKDVIDRLFSRDNDVLKAIAEKFGKLIKSISLNILSDYQEAEECENDTYLNLWNSIPPDCPDNLTAYIAKIARNISIDRLRYKLRSKRKGSVDALLSELDECIPATDDTAQSADDTLKNSINAFLSTLKERDRIIFMKRYFCCDSIKTIAKSQGISESNVTTILNRTRNKLKIHLNGDGIAV